MYLPRGKNVYSYDVNSLYPFVMKENLFPVGSINEFEGDITILTDKYWIAESKVSTKKDLKHPYLQIHHKSKNGYRTQMENSK